MTTAYTTEAAKTTNHQIAALRLIATSAPSVKASPNTTTRPDSRSPPYTVVSRSWTARTRTKIPLMIQARRCGQRRKASRKIGVTATRTRFTAATRVYPALKSLMIVGILSSVPTTRAATSTRRPPAWVSGSPG